MFSAGSAQVTTDAAPAFNQIAKFIRASGFPVEVLVTQTQSHFPMAFQNYTNWELSADEADAARRLLEHQGVSPGKIQSVLGMADRDLKMPDQGLRQPQTAVSPLSLSCLRRLRQASQRMK